MNSKQLFALLLTGCISASALAGGTLDRIRDSGHIRFAYLRNAKPFTSVSGTTVEGYGAELCQRIADQVRTSLGLSQLSVDWVEVGAENVFSSVSSGDADVLCTPSNATLERRKSLSYSLPVFAAGVRAVVRSDAPMALRDVLEAQPSQRNVWRGSPALNLIEKTRFAAVTNTSSERWLQSKVKGFKLNTTTRSVPNYQAGILALVNREVDVFLAERDVVLAAMDPKTQANVVVLNRQITNEPLSFALPRNDEDFRLQVDTALSAAYNAPEFSSMYVKHFGRLDDATRNFFAWVTPAP